MLWPKIFPPNIPPYNNYKFNKFYIPLNFIYALRCALLGLSPSMLYWCLWVYLINMLALMITYRISREMYP